DGLGYSIDEFNRPLITADMEKRLEAARADIISGKIIVLGYKTN
ncbi:MAG: BMP family ABC transporter substrate-binding protein, partial [Proteobacteria bacterium]|nr:BMP family ABC transporter substrate-binding protein [Pseudomonadota bacterium]